ncbi:MAG: dTDP-4-dehydrorhamnose reductase [Bacteroidia bacterium]
MKKVIVTGANGQLGSDIVHELQTRHYAVIPKTHHQFDVIEYSRVDQILREQKPDVLINTAAFHQVDQCEADPEKARQVNRDAPANLAKICHGLGIRFIHFSTDYVFDGKKDTPYLESDAAEPLNEYGKSKREGELAILKENPDALILRIAAIYGQQPCRAKNGLNFIRLMLKLADEKGSVKVVDDEIVSPTSTLSIARMIPLMIEKEISGVIHITSEGACSWYDFAKTIFELSDRKHIVVQRAKSGDFPAKTPRPAYSVLENAKLKEQGFPLMPHWKESLEEYLKALEKEENVQAV